MIPQNTPLGSLHNGETTIGNGQRAEQSGHGRDVKPVRTGQLSALPMIHHLTPAQTA